TAGGTGLLSRPIEQKMRQQFTFNPRWNMLSIPLAVDNDSKESVFPDAVSEAFSFDGQYIPQTTLENGKGYWLKFSDTAVVSIDGYAKNKIVIDVKEGWNMIGSISSNLPVYEIEEYPEGIIQSNFYGYESGYQIANAIQPSKAYWVKVSQNGQLVLDGEQFLLNDSAHTLPPDSILEPDLYNKIRITDNSGLTQTLYFSNQKESDDLLKKYFMPPLPPDGSFDVRFATGSMFECASAQQSKQIPITVSTLHYPVTIAWERHQQIAQARLLVNEDSFDVTQDGKTVIQTEENKIVLVLEMGNDPTVPKEFALEQNYPNPFNPSTVIHYQLKAKSYVLLKVYNLLGEEVSTPVNEVQDAGYKSVTFTASSLPSGIYFYKLTTSEGFADVKRMALIR
ncbi:MAG: T9SS type A sorting domain-containing protein, partial [Ignavibacteriae bacterium]|nr:T9SS type A sorting domain-containing protein [Ignavibacteriota bacterium]